MSKAHDGKLGLIAVIAIGVGGMVGGGFRMARRGIHLRE